MSNRDRDAWRKEFDAQGEATVKALISNNRYVGQIKLEAERWLNELDIVDRDAAFKIAESAAASAASSKRAAWASVIVALLALLVAAATAFVK